MANPQSQLYELLAESRSRTRDIQQIRQRAAAKLPQSEQALLQRVSELRSTPNPDGEEYFAALEDLDKIRRSMAMNQSIPMEKGARTGETKTENGKTYVLNANSRWERQAEYEQPSLFETPSHRGFIEAAFNEFGLGEIAETRSMHVQVLANLSAQFTELQTQFDQASKELGMAEAFASPIGQSYLSVNKALMDARKRRDSMARELMGPIREKLFREAQGFTGELPKVDFPIEMVIDEFAQITGNKGFSALKEIVQEDDRAWADDEGILNIGSMERPPERIKMSVWHELGHFIEFENPELAKMAANWVFDRATGAEMPLNLMPGQSIYDDDEMVYPDHFADPYIGKIYSDGTTEVISVGMESFVDEQSMLALFDRDPDHFALMLAVLNA